MRTLRNVMLAFGLVALAAACGGKDKSEATTPDNTGGGDMGTDTGGAGYGDMGGGDMGGDPCAEGGAGGDMGGDPCGGGE